MTTSIPLHNIWESLYRSIVGHGKKGAAVDKSVRVQVFLFHRKPENCWPAVRSLFTVSDDPSLPARQGEGSGPAPEIKTLHVVKPDVVLYEEPLDPAVVSGAVEMISKADLLMVGGTSLVVYPAAGLVDYYKGNELVVINKQPIHFNRKSAPTRKISHS